MEIWQILTIVFGLLAGFFGFYWSKTKTAIKEIGILFNIVSEALSDDSLTKEELTIIVSQVQKILEIFKSKGYIDETTKIEFKEKLLKLKK